MTKRDFRHATALFGPGKITAFLQGGLSVTGTWAYLDDEDVTTAIVLIDGNDARHVVPIETITSLREVKAWSKPKPLTYEEEATLAFVEGRAPPPHLSGRKPGFAVFDEVG